MLIKPGTQMLNNVLTAAHAWVPLMHLSKKVRKSNLGRQKKRKRRKQEETGERFCTFLLPLTWCFLKAGFVGSHCYRVLIDTTVAWGPVLSCVVVSVTKDLPNDRISRLEKAMAPHSSTLAWKIPWMEEPGGLQPMGLQRLVHHWATEHTQIYWNV